jgi:hypothetical protein
MAGDRSVVTALRASSLAVALALLSNLSWGDRPAPVEKPAPRKPAPKAAPKPPRKDVELPGPAIDLGERRVGVGGSGGLERGLLALVACTKGSGTEKRLQ